MSYILQKYILQQSFAYMKTFIESPCQGSNRSIKLCRYQCDQKHQYNENRKNIHANTRKVIQSTDAITRDRR